jgi:myosin-5
MARKSYLQLRQEAAALKLQKNFRQYSARKSYLIVLSAAITLQTGLRAMTACNEFILQKQAKAAIIFQVLSIFSAMIFYSCTLLFEGLDAIYH